MKLRQWIIIGAAAAVAAVGAVSVTPASASDHKVLAKPSDQSLRALGYIERLGGPGLEEATRLAILNANYLRAQLQEAYDLPFDGPSMHECVFSDRTLTPHGVQTLDLAKRLLDYGFYAPTIYFPLAVKGAIMIEPTATESKATHDEFVAAMLAIAEETRVDPQTVRGAPHRTKLARLDETRAARRPVLRWRPGAAG